MIRDLAAGLLDRNSGPEASIVAVATLTFAISAALGTIDTLVLLCSTGAVYFLAFLLDNRSARGADRSEGADIRGHLVAWSLAAGGAAGAKYTAWPAIIALQGAIALWVALCSEGKKSRLLMAAILPGALILLPWPIRNLIHSGNPIMPATLGGLLPGLSDAAYAAMRQDAHGVGLSPGALPSVLALALDHGVRQLERSCRQVGRGQVRGPFLVDGHSSLSCRGGESLEARLPWAALGFISLFISLAMFRMVRFTYPGLGVLAAVAGAGFAGWRKHSDRVLGGGAVVSVPVVAALILCTLLMMRVSGNLTLGYRFARLRGNVNNYFEGRALVEPFESRLALFQMEANTVLPEDASVLLVGETRSAYLKRPLAAPSYLTPSPLVEALRHGEEDSAARALRDAGYTHVYLFHVRVHEA